MVHAHFARTGYLRYNMCGDDMVADSVRRIRCYGCDYMAQPVSSLQYNQHDHFQFAGIFGVRFTFADYVLRSGEWQIMMLRRLLLETDFLFS